MKQRLHASTQVHAHRMPGATDLAARNLALQTPQLLSAGLPLCGGAPATTRTGTKSMDVRIATTVPVNYTVWHTKCRSSSQEHGTRFTNERAFIGAPHTLLLRGAMERTADQPSHSTSAYSRGAELAPMPATSMRMQRRWLLHTTRVAKEESSRAHRATTLGCRTCAADAHANPHYSASSSTVATGCSLQAQCIRSLLVAL